MRMIYWNYISDKMNKQLASRGRGNIGRVLTLACVVSVVKQLDSSGSNNYDDGYHLKIVYGSQ